MDAHGSNSGEEVFDVDEGWRNLSGSGAIVAHGRDLSHCEADMDTELDGLFGGVDISDAGGVLLVHRFERIPEMGLSIGSDWDEFDCGILRGAFVGEFYPEILSNAFRAKYFQCVWDGLFTVVERDCCDYDVVAGPVLDVPAENIDQNLSAER